MPYTNGIDGHEERIQRLEENQSTLLVQSKEALLKIQNLGERFEDSISQIGDKIEASFGAIQERLQQGQDKMDSTEATVDSYADRLKTLEAGEVKRLERWSNVKKLAFFVVTPVAGIFVKEFGVWFYGWIVG